LYFKYIVEIPINKGANSYKLQIMKKGNCSISQLNASLYESDCREDAL